MKDKIWNAVVHLEFSVPPTWTKDEVRTYISGKIVDSMALCIGTDIRNLRNWAGRKQTRKAVRRG